MNQTLHKNLSHFLKGYFIITDRRSSNDNGNMISFYPKNGIIYVSFYFGKIIQFKIETDEFSITKFKTLEKIFTKSYENPKTEIIIELLNKLNNLSKINIYNI